MYKELQTLEGKEVYFIQGSVEVEDRRKIQQLMEKQDNVVCVAISKIFSTGISIKNIHYMVYVVCFSYFSTSEIRVEKISIFVAFFKFSVQQKHEKNPHIYFFWCI
jgi:hypothetical protein